MDSSSKSTNEPPKVIYIKGKRNNGKSQMYPLMCHIFGDYVYNPPVKNSMGK